MITFEEQKGVFRLDNEHLSMVLALRADDMGSRELLLTYLGLPIQGADCTERMEYPELSSHESERMALPYACPTEGRGDYRPCMVCARDASGQRCTELYYTGYEIVLGKPKLAGLPATYTEAEAEAETLTVMLTDPVTGLEMRLSYTIFAALSAIACSAQLSNHGEQPLLLTNAASFCLTLPGCYDMLHLHGTWARERAVERVAPARLTRMIESTRGASGHEHNPFAALVTPEATEFSGECFGVTLVYSGDFRIAVDENPLESTRVVAGLNPRTFEWRLNPGETFQTPEALCAYSQRGLNGMSQTLHQLMRTRLCRGEWRDMERPILINNWEATYFDFNHEKILEIARAAQAVGVELMVLDDGWFGHRDADNSSLGDWVEDRRKLPRGLRALAEDVNALGMQFGLWFEPEMVSPDSDLYRAHPDWCLHAQGRRRTQARQQLILDMSRADVQDYVIEAVSAVLRSAPISYVKWDMNRNFKEVGSALLLDGREGEISHRYMLGLYHVLEAVTSAFPHVLFENCAGGGGRFDAGMLYYMPQTWTSDDTDAVERLQIQYGTSMCYPTSAMGAHVSACPNHQVKRVTSMRMRGDVALGGNFGYELDMSKQTPEDLEEIRRQVQQVKKLRHTTQQGVFTRLKSPFEGNVTAWQFADEHYVILCVYRVMDKPHAPREVIRMANVPQGVYRLEDGTVMTSDTMMHAGVTVAFGHGDFASRVMVFEHMEDAQ